MFLTYKRIGLFNIKLEWNVADFKKNIWNYKISKYILKVSKNYSPFLSNLVLLNFQTFNLEPNYVDNLRLNSIIFNDIQSESTCQAYCCIKENCIFYAFVTRDDIFEELTYGSCILKSKIDISNGTNGSPEQIRAFSILTYDSTHIYSYDLLEQQLNHRFRIDYYTPYGLQSSSNEISVTLDETPINGSLYSDNFSLSFILNIQLEKSEEYARLFLVFKEDFLFYIGTYKSKLLTFIMT